jgi:hypothetical protein
MLKFFQNAKEEPKVFYCKHIAPGVCAYADETILIGEEALKEMDKTFAGKPIYVNHQKVDLENIQQEADGYVAESFYLPEDGSHWAKMIIVSDKGHEAIRKGWKVSNAYVPDEFGIGGEWHNIPYNREVMKAHYTHLALVDNPRYEEAVVMTPEDFKTYKESKREQLKQLENSKNQKGEKRMNWKLFERKEVTNSEDIANKMVELSNGSTVSIREMINAVEEDLKEKEAKCNETLESVVKVNGEDMTVKDLIKEYESKCNKCNEDEDKKDEEEEKKAKKASKKNAEEDKEEEKKDSEEEDKEKEEKESKKNAKKNEGEEIDKRKEIDEIGGFLKDKGLSDEDIRFVIGLAEKLSYEKDEAGKDNEDEDIKEDLTVEKEEKEVEEKKDKKNSKDLLEAEEKANAKGFQGQVVDTMSRRLARGQERYGSAK